MNDDESEQALFAGLSRELQLRCAPDGTIVWLDQRARDFLGVDRGARLRELAAPGTEDKLERLLREEEPGAAWEVVLAVQDRPVVLAFRSRRTPEGVVALTGSRVPEEYAGTADQLSASMSELAALHRETDRQQRELLRRHEELVRLHRELEDSHRGVVALHNEIGEKDDSLRRADEVKARLVANVSHEFRTPLNSILGLTNLLLSRADGEINHEQEIQLGFIRQSCESLYALVNDLLDLSKIEAGKVALHVGTFGVAGLFAAMRGMLRPLATREHVRLDFVDPSEPIELESDESKVAQVLRNLVSNALKFTTQGEIVVTAEQVGDDVLFRVRDTGIGIAPDHQVRVFEEFFQVDGELQRTVRGTGLGLSLSRHIAVRLGGDITLESVVGEGSTFTLRVPRLHPEASELSALTARSRNLAPGQQPVLVVEDDRQTLFLYEKYLRGSGFQVVPARTVDEARAALQVITPAAIVLDIMLEGEATWTFLQDLKSDPVTREIPILVVTVTSREEKARALGADEFFMKPMDRDWLVAKLKSLARTSPIETVLVIDDDQVSRYLVKKHLLGLPYKVVEAASGVEGVRIARELVPQVIFLDFVMPEMSAFDVIDELKRDPRTRSIPVIVHTSKNLAEDERVRLEQDASAIVSKQSLSREIAIARIREALEKAGIGGSARKGADHDPA